ncbi:MAG TPA: hypothetical protein PLX10_00665, partial [Candidatus Paceibacterota bacterium]|nr:hypothetical protein [Candidatus Paceibacterota bacterium]
DLSAGSYSVEYQLFKNQNVAYRGNLDLSVIEKDTSTYNLWQRTSDTTKLIILASLLLIIGMAALIIRNKIRRQL